MKNLAIGVMLTTLGAVSAHAGGKLNNAIIDAGENISGSHQKAIVMFHTDKSPSVVLSQVRNAMQVRDPSAFFYPYWITEIYHEQTVGENCGFIIGKWWSNGRTSADGANKWEPRVYDKVKSSVNLISFGYYNDKIENAMQLGDPLSADGKDVLNACKS